MQIYVGNIPTSFTDADLRALAEPFGKVKAASIGMDKKTDKPAGYGFIEMPVKSEARAAIDGIRGKEIKGKKLLAKALKSDDAFFAHAQNLHAGGKTGGSFTGAKQQRGNIGPRSTGVMRRGGQRGS